jgi:hypothetical protein
MIGNYIDGLGWEILCDNLGLFVGYMHGTTRPDDTHYEVFCETTFITKVGSDMFINGILVIPTNTIIPNYSQLTADFVLIEVDTKLIKCYLNNTTIEGDWFNNLEILYTTYLSIL